MATESIFIDVSQKRHDQRVSVKSHMSGTTAAVVMIVAAIIALILTNTGFHEVLAEVNEFELGITLGSFHVGLTVELLVNDLLMAFFFLMVGCELKYEMTVGALAKPKQAILPMVAALGGVCGPAIIFICMNMGGPAANGWAIPTATDIAFALAVMSLFGDRMPIGAKVFFTTLAIADDLVAIIVIALFYSTTLNFVYLGVAAVIVVLLIILNRMRVFSLWPYALLGAALWFCFFNSGIHATLSGVVLAFCLPVRSDVQLGSFADWTHGKLAAFNASYDANSRVLGQHEVTEIAREVEEISHRVTPPLQRVEHRLEFFVNFIVLPVFAFVNAQVFVAGADMGAILTNPATLGVCLGLLFGKPIGILLTTFILVRFLGFDLPKNTRWGHMVGIGILGGIGFTMAILVAGLAFTDPELIMMAKVGILIGTFSAAIIGLVYLFIYLAISEKRNGGKVLVEEEATQVSVTVDAPGDADDIDLMHHNPQVSAQMSELVAMAVREAVSDAIERAEGSGQMPTRITISLESDSGEPEVVTVNNPMYLG